MARRKSSRKTTRRPSKARRKGATRRGGGRAPGRGQPPWALLGAGALLVGAGAYVLWPRAASAAALPLPPPASNGSASASARATASGSGSGSGSRSGSLPSPGPSGLNPGSSGGDSVADLVAEADKVNNPPSSDPITSAWDWLTGG